VDWTVAREAQLCRMWRQGCTVWEIAEVLDTSLAAIKGKARRMGLPNRH